MSNYRLLVEKLFERNAFWLNIVLDEVAASTVCEFVGAGAGASATCWRF
jgi:hypothetical protein